MPFVNQGFPLSAAVRMDYLNKLKEGKPISTVKVPGHGTQPVYRIKLQYLSYNPYNTRFLSHAKTWEKRLGRELDNERPEDVEQIEKFLWEYKKDKNENTINSLIREGQLQPGVVTLDGLILAGNRRFRLINEIDRNPAKYGIHANLQEFEAAILDTTLEKKDIVEYESFYQYGQEDKVDYDPIQKYIAAWEQRNVHKFSFEKIAANFAALTNGDIKIVKRWLDVYDLMDEYLDYIDEPGIYTALTGNEESFLNLLDTIKSLRGRAQNTSWPYTDFDIDDLKLRYYDYIRIGKSTHEFRLFKKIFLNKTRWTKFNATVKKSVEDASDGFLSIDEYRSKFKNDNEEQISVRRKNDFKEKTEKKLDKLFGDERSYIQSKEEEETPLKTAQQAYQKLEKLMSLVDNGLDNSVNVDELLEKVKDIQKIVGKIKQTID